MIYDVNVINLNKFTDSRGSLYKSYTKTLFDNLSFSVEESWFTISSKNTIRGMHMQTGKFPSRKIVTIIKGSIVDVLLDCRTYSKTYGKFMVIDMNSSEDSHIMLYIPVGVAHGYKVLEDNSVVQYFANEIHHAKSDVGFYYNSFGYDWNLDNPILSDRDMKLPYFNSK